jgi:hypothetical protein
MPITAVTPTPIPAPGQPLPNPADLTTWPVRMAEMHRWMRETLSPGAELIGQQAYTNALAAQEAALAAYINANYKGAWSALTGALAVPALVSHSGERWNLLSDLADVTASEPGVDPEWELFQLPPALGVGFDPTGTSLVAVNVQAALVALSGGVDKALEEFRNPVRNGGMRIAQTGTSFNFPAGSAFTLDGWKYGQNSTAAVTVSQQSAITPDNANAKWLIATVTTADAAIAAAEFSFIYHDVEGFDIAEYKGRTFTIGFWVKSAVTGVHCVGLRSGPNDAFYVAEYTVAAANTPQFVSITIVGGLPAIGTWNFTNGSGLQLCFPIACGSNFTGAAGAWTLGNKIATASQVNCLATIGNVFGITAVQINPGAVAKRFQQVPYGQEFARCQRYYETVDVQVGEDTQFSTKGNGYCWKVEKRIAPTLTVTNGIGTGSTATVTFVVGGLGTSKSTIYQSTGTNLGTPGTSGHKIILGDARL